MSTIPNPGHQSRDLDGCLRAVAAGCRSVVEFGCGFGDRLAAMDVPCKLGVEVHRPYLERFRDASAVTILADAREQIVKLPNRSVDLVLLVDFIEHLDAADAAAFLGQCQRIARRRVAAFVPEGNHPQTSDVYGLGGDYWQTHRSTWSVADLSRHGFDVARWEGWHDQPGKDSGALFAVWDRPRCSIVIATYNKAEALDRSLASIRAQAVQFGYEIIVVDDGSADHTAAVCASHGVRYARLDRPYYANPAPARNRGLRLATGDVVIMQCEVIHQTPNAVELLVERLTPGFFDFATVYNARLADDGQWIVGEPYSGPPNPRPLFFLGAAFRADLYAVGGNDEEFVLPGWEDNWLADCLIRGRWLQPRHWGDVVAYHADHARPDWVPAVQEEMRRLYEHKVAAGRFVASGGAWE